MVMMRIEEAMAGMDTGAGIRTEVVLVVALVDEAEATQAIEVAEEVDLVEAEVLTAEEEEVGGTEEPTNRSTM